MEQVILGDIYRGPPPFAHGGYASGILAKYIGQGARVVLSGPTPRMAELDIITDAGSVALAHKGRASITAYPIENSDLPEVPAACFSCSPEIAAEAGARFPELRGGYHEDCYCCGGAEGDQRLNVALGQRGDAEAGWLAGLWTPPEWAADEKGRIAEEHLWAAMDCPGWYTWLAKEDNLPLCLLGTMVFEVVKRPMIGEALILCSWPIEGGAGRKRYSGVAVINKSGEYIARGQQIWIIPK